MNRRAFVLIAILVAVGSALWWGIRRPSTADSRPATGSGNEPSEKAPVRQPEAVHSGLSQTHGAAPLATGKAEIARQIRSVLDALRAGDPEEIERWLATLGQALDRPDDREAAIAAILEFLASGEDASTGRGFVISEGGLLADATTLRVYLMDRLGRLCRDAGSGEAAEIARQTLAAFGSADEWAISMRNVAWADTGSGAFLEERVNAMIRHPRWNEHPTTGMLEAFDVIVHTGSMAAVPELARQISLPESALGRASGVALDRLASSHPLELTTLLNQQPDLMAATPMARADLFAHADLSVPQQREQLESYLLRPDVDAAEREKFFSSLIQTGQFVSHNLVTPLVPPEEPAQAAVRLETLVGTVNGWMRDERFRSLGAELSSLGEAVNAIIDEISADESDGGGGQNNREIR